MALAISTACGDAGPTGESASPRALVDSIDPEPDALVDLQDLPEVAVELPEGVHIDGADPAPLRVDWTLADDAAVETTSGSVHARVEHHGPEPALVSGVWTVEYAGQRAVLGVEAFVIEPGHALDLTLEPGELLPLDADAAAPGVVWLSLQAYLGEALWLDEGPESAPAKLHPGTEGLRFWPEAGGLKLARPATLSALAASDSPPGLYATLAPELAAELKSGAIIAVVQWTPPDDAEAELLAALDPLASDAQDEQGAEG